MSGDNLLFPLITIGDPFSVNHTTPTYRLVVWSWSEHFPVWWERTRLTKWTNSHSDPASSETQGWSVRLGKTRGRSLPPRCRTEYLSASNKECNLIRLTSDTVKLQPASLRHTVLNYRTYFNKRQPAILGPCRRFLFPQYSLSLGIGQIVIFTKSVVLAKPKFSLLNSTIFLSGKFGLLDMHQERSVFFFKHIYLR